MKNMHDKLDAAIGAVYGFALGEALSSPLEGLKPAEVARYYGVVTTVFQDNKRSKAWEVFKDAVDNLGEENPTKYLVDQGHDANKESFEPLIRAMVMLLSGHGDQECIDQTVITHSELIMPYVALLVEMMHNRLEGAPVRPYQKYLGVPGGSLKAYEVYKGVHYFTSEWATCEGAVIAATNMTASPATATLSGMLAGAKCGKESINPSFIHQIPAEMIETVEKMVEHINILKK